MMQTLFRAVSRNVVRLSSTVSNVADPTAPVIQTLEDKIYDFLIKKGSVSWRDLQENEFPRLVKEHFSQTSSKRFSNTTSELRSFSSLIIGSLAKNRQPELLRDFVQHYGIGNLSVPQVALYIRHCGDVDEILRSWRFLKERNGTLFDPNSTVYLTEALCKTAKWRDAISLIDSLSEIGEDSVVARRLVIEKMFEERHIEEALTWSGQLYSTHDMTAGFEFKPALLALETIERVFEMAARLDLLFDKTLFASPLWNPLFDVTLTSITRPSKCPQCKTSLNPAREITNDDLERLRKAVRARLLKKGKNLFLTTTPKEFADFERFIKQRGPFDIVLDGLNIGYQCGNHVVAEEARRLVREEQVRVLIIGRHHMMRWPGMKRLPYNALVYTTQDISKDDPFIIYACLQSHADCTIMTQDHFRDHKFLLNPKSKYIIDSGSKVAEPNEVIELETLRLFSRWLNTRHRQIGCKPLQHDIVTQKDPKGWHVPVFTNQEEAQGKFEQARWACLRYKRTK